MNQEELRRAITVWMSNLSSEHTHQYVIPVEWFYEFHNGQIVVQDIPTHPERLKVTKLRCACGEEIER